jgi:pilus assembly protein CpaF
MFGKRTIQGASAGLRPPAPVMGTDPVLTSHNNGEAMSHVQKQDEPSGSLQVGRQIETASSSSASGAVKTDEYYRKKATIFGALIEAIDLTQLSRLDTESAREEIRDIVNEIVALKNFAMSIAEQEELLEDICNDVLGYGPLEPLLARDDIADIMVNGSGKTYIEVGGKIQLTNVRFSR